VHVRSAARFLSLLFNPLVAATLYLVGVVLAHRGWAEDAALLWLLVVAAPGVVLALGIRRGVWSDLDVSRLAERRTFMPFAVGFAAVGAFGAAWLRFPRLLAVSALAILVWLALSTAVGFVWKISLHVGGATGLLWLVGMTFGGAVALSLVWIPPLVAWARLVLRRHDLPQVVAGAAAGSLAAVVAAHLVGGTAFGP
jgi:hypothetical protein